MTDFFGSVHMVEITNSSTMDIVQEESVCRYVWVQEKSSPIEDEAETETRLKHYHREVAKEPPPHLARRLDGLEAIFMRAFVSHPHPLFL